MARINKNMPLQERVQSLLEKSGDHLLWVGQVHRHGGKVTNHARYFYRESGKMVGVAIRTFLEVGRPSCGQPMCMTPEHCTIPLRGRLPKVSK